MHCMCADLNHIDWNLTTTIGWNELGVIITSLAFLASLLFSIFNLFLIFTTSRAKLEFSVINHNKTFYFKVENIGVRAARSIRFSVNILFVNNILVDTERDRLNNFSKNTLYIPRDDSKFFFLSPSKDFEGSNGGISYSDDDIDKILNTKMIIRGWYWSGIIPIRICKSFKPNQFLTSTITLHDYPSRTN